PSSWTAFSPAGVRVTATRVGNVTNEQAGRRTKSQGRSERARADTMWGIVGPSWRIRGQKPRPSERTRRSAAGETGRNLGRDEPGDIPDKREDDAARRLRPKRQNTQSERHQRERERDE